MNRSTLNALVGFISLFEIVGQPILLDVEGIQRLSKALSQIREVLTTLVLGLDDIVNVVARKNWNCLELENDNLRVVGGTNSSIQSTKSTTAATATPHIPKFMEWLVTMWHFGADAVHEYSGEKFNCRWELAQNIVASIYSKDWKTSENENNYKPKIRGSRHESSVKSRIRVEKQEYPKVSLGEALRNKCPEVMEAFSWI